MIEGKKVLVVSAHAADYVWRAGGTIAKYIKHGAEVYVVVLSFGVRGESNDLWKQAGATYESVKENRLGETKQAAEILGIQNIEFWDLPDYPMSPALAQDETRERMIRKIREVQPDIIITHDKNGEDILNPDHNNVAQFVFACSIQANSNGYRLEGTKTTRQMRLFGFEPHQTELSKYVPGTLIDISEVYDQKVAAMQCFKAQKCLNVPLLLDGVKAAKIDIPNGGCMDMHINAVERGMTVVGTALTVETANGDNFPIHVASYSFAAEGYVMVIDGKAYEGRAYFGDLIMGACQAVGFEGMVIDGCTRDRDGNVELKFPVYSRGFMPRGPIKKDEGSINTPIMCGGVKVCPGDLVVGDSDGVCVIPVEYIETVLEEAEKKKAYEDKRTETIAAYREAKKNGTILPQLAPQWVLDMMK